MFETRQTYLCMSYFESNSRILSSSANFSLSFFVLPFGRFIFPTPFHKDPVSVSKNLQNSKLSKIPKSKQLIFFNVFLTHRRIISFVSIILSPSLSLSFSLDMNIKMNFRLEDPSSFKNEKRTKLLLQLKVSIVLKISNQKAQLRSLALLPLKLTNTIQNYSTKNLLQNIFFFREY